jgi:hypothetical protein
MGMGDPGRGGTRWFVRRVANVRGRRHGADVRLHGRRADLLGAGERDWRAHRRGRRAGLSIGSDISVTEPGGRGAKPTANVPVPSRQATLYVEVGGVGNYAPGAPSAGGGFDGWRRGRRGRGRLGRPHRHVRAVAPERGKLLIAGVPACRRRGGGGASHIAAGGDAGNADGSGIPTSLIIDGAPAIVVLPPNDLRIGRPGSAERPAEPPAATQTFRVGRPSGRPGRRANAPRGFGGQPELRSASVTRVSE